MRLGRSLSLSMVFSLLGGLVAVLPPLAAEAAEPGVTPMPSVPVTAGKSASPLPSAELPAWQGQPVAWPVAASATVDMPADSRVSSFAAGDEPAPVVVGGLPLSITAGASAGDPEGLLRSPSPSGDGGQIEVGVLSQAEASGLGVRGVVLTAAPHADLGVPVRLAVDYAAFANAYGGDYGSRLRIVQMPACALTTPSLKDCRQQTEVPGSINNPAAKLVSVSVDIPAAAAPAGAPVAGMSAQLAEPQGATVFAVTAGASSASGDFSKTKFNEALSWTAGGNAGGFSTSVGVKVPPVAGGLAPSVSLNYSSQSVDGLGSGTNNQASEAGDGWSLSNVSYVERSYRPCRHDGLPANAGDLCFVGHVPVNIVLNGQSTQLVQDQATQVVRVVDDSLGWRVDLLNDAPNGVKNGEHFRITTMDGTQYFFGSRPRDSGGGAAAVPVYSNDPFEPCYQTSGSGFANSWCLMGYRWNLDHVVDRFGNTMTYHWELYKGSYGANGNTTALGFDMTSVLRQIDYGTHTGVAGGAQAKVVFSYGYRCYATDCTTNFSTTNWPETPWDQYCQPAALECSGRTSPTFWSVYRLDAIETLVKDAAAPGGWSTTDKITTDFRFPATGDFVTPAGDDTAPALWLAYVRRPNSANEQAIVTNGIRLNNTVVWGQDVGMAPLTRYRIDAFSGPAGDLTSVTYSGEDCTRAEANMAIADRNTRRCYPRWEGDAFRWYQKYVVTEIEQHDRIGGAPSVLHRYQYSNNSVVRNDGTAGGDYEKALWHFDDNWLVPLSERSHNQWRGYTNVRTIVGARDNTGNQQVTDTVFYRGMHLDRALGAWNTRGVSINDGLSPTLIDHPAMAGKPRVVTQQDGLSGPWLRMSRHGYQIDETGESPLGDTTVKRWRVLENSTETFMHHPNGGPSNEAYTRNTLVQTTWDTHYPVPTFVKDHGETSGTHSTIGIADDVCNSTTYVHDTAKWIVGVPVTTQTTDCATNPTAANVLSSSRTYYDDAALGQLGTGAQSLGRVTRTEAITKATAYPPAASDWITSGTIAVGDYDLHGRAKKATDAMGRHTTTVYTPATGGPVTGVAVTNNIGHTSTSTLDIRFGTPKEVTDPNGVTTLAEYDVQGRMLKVWKNGRAKASAPDAQYEYVLRLSQPSYITTRVLGPAGTLLPASYEMFDGLLRPRRTETPSANGFGIGRNISDIRYNATGGVVESVTFGNDSNPNPNLDGFDPANIAQHTKVTYNNLGEQTLIAPWAFGAARGSTWNTTINPQGHRTITTPPAGGTATTTYTSARGTTTELRQAKPGGGTLNTTYTHDRAGQLTTVKDPLANQWLYEYDKLGRKTKATDPDAGVTTTTYRNDGSVESTKDALNQVLWNTYDAIGRKTGLYHTSVTAPNQLSAWEYDTAVFDGTTTPVKGQLASTTRKDVTGDYKTTLSKYDNAYRAKQTSFTAPGFGLGGTGLTYTISNTYAPNGAPVTTNLPAAGKLTGETLTTGYNSNTGLPTTLSTDGYGGTNLIWATTYDTDGLVQERIHGISYSMVKVVSSYDLATRRLNKLTTSTQTGQYLASFIQKHAADYTYDPTGNITAAGTYTDGIRDQAECFQYDTLRRLTQAWTQASLTSGCTPQKTGADPYWRTWAMDDIGNRTSQVDKNADGTTGTTWTHQNGSAGGVKPHQVKQITATGPLSGTPNRTFSYDVAGNMTSRTTETGVAQILRWDTENHLKAVEQGGSTVASYVYNTDGSRLLATDGNTKTLYLPDGTELEKIGAADPLGQRYLGGVAVRNSSGLKWTVNNHQGTTVAQIDATTEVLTPRRMMPYGEPRGTQPTWLGTKGYVGGTKDAPTGLTHLGAREYDPSTGRFVSVDPIMDFTDPQQWHPYTYSNNNPVTFADPSGLKAGNPDEGLSGDTPFETVSTDCSSFASCNAPTPFDEIYYEAPLSPNVFMNPTDPRFAAMSKAWNKWIEGHISIDLKWLEKDVEFWAWKIVCNRTPGLCGDLTLTFNMLMPIEGSQPDGTITIAQITALAFGIGASAGPWRGKGRNIDKPVLTGGQLRCNGNLACGKGSSIGTDLAGLPTGKQRHVRTVDTEGDLLGLYSKWTQGGTVVTPKGYNGTMVRLPDGSTVGWRNASKSGGATIDVKLPDGTNQKVHID